MLMMPFVRLIAIYALVGVAIIAFLKRDQIMASVTMPEEPALSTQIKTPAVLATLAMPPPRSTAVQPVKTPQPAQHPTYSAPPAFGSQITPQYFGQAATPATPAKPRGETMVERWTKARQVFSQGPPAEAAKLYEALTTDFPENADLQGETGNLYYNLGQFDKAATHYLAVGKIAANAGNMQMAGRMLSLLQRMAPAKAAELQAALNGG